MWHFREPSVDRIAAFRVGQEQLTLTYPEQGATRSSRFPLGYDHDRNAVVLGEGEEVFLAACNGFRRWEMFPRQWMRVEPPDAPQSVGQCVTLLCRIGGIWCLNAARIVYGIDEAGQDGVRRRIGFAYGTLPGHVECGEERFTLAWLDNNSVVYELQAFSRPRHWMVRMGYPVARAIQRRFVRESQARMRNLVRRAVPMTEEET